MGIMATQQIDEYYESLAYWKQQAQDYEQALRDIEYNTIMNMTAEILFSVQLDMLEKNKQMGDEITALKSKLKIAREALNTALNYLHWREDDLIGDDCIGDGRLTAGYKNKVSEIEKAISKIGGEM